MAPDERSEVVVCGAGGITANAVLRALADAGRPATALVHGKHREASAHAAGAARCVVADYDDLALLRAAFAGADAVYFVAPTYRERETEWVGAAVEACASVGVERFVYHSVLHPATPSMPHHARKAAAEATVRASSTVWSILQPAMYAQTALRMRAVSPAGRIEVPFDPGAPFAVVDVRDVAACAVAVLSDRQHDYAGYEIAGGPVQQFREMCAAMDRAAGDAREVVRVDPAEVEYDPGWSDQQRGEFRAMCAEYDAHGLVGAPTTVQLLLGRPPTSFAEVALRELG